MVHLEPFPRMSLFLAPQNTTDYEFFNFFANFDEFIDELVHFETGSSSIVSVVSFVPRVCKILVHQFSQK